MSTCRSGKRRRTYNRGMTSDRKYLLERVGEAAVAQLYADGFEGLPLDQKILIWHLYQAALAGRDIYYDQRYAHNLEMRDILEEIITHAEGVDAGTLGAIERYTKLFWINVGPYNNLTARKFLPEFTPEDLAAAAAQAIGNGATISVEMVERLRPMFFNPDIDPIVTNK